MDYDEYIAEEIDKLIRALAINAENTLGVEVQKVYDRAFEKQSIFDVLVNLKEAQDRREAECEEELRAWENSQTR